MMPNRKKSREILTDLRERFLDGEKMSVADIIKEYFNTKNPHTYLMLEKKVRNWMQNIKRSFRKKHGLWFGNLDDNGNYGLISTKEEVNYSMTRYYRFVKGTVSRAQLLAKDAEKKNLLPTGRVVQEKMLVSRIKEDTDES